MASEEQENLNLKNPSPNSEWKSLNLKDPNPLSSGEQKGLNLNDKYPNSVIPSDEWILPMVLEVQWVNTVLHPSFLFLT